MYFATQLFSLSGISYKNRGGIHAIFLQKTRVKPGAMLIEIVLSRDSLYLKLRFVSNIFWTKIPKSSHCELGAAFFWPLASPPKPFFHFRKQENHLTNKDEARRPSAMPHLHLGQVFWPQPLGDSGMFGISPFLEARCTKVPLGRQRLR